MQFITAKRRVDDVSVPMFDTVTAVEINRTRFDHLVHNLNVVSQEYKGIASHVKQTTLCNNYNDVLTGQVSGRGKTLELDQDILYIHPQFKRLDNQEGLIFRSALHEELE